mgnify:CR=1 FL=1
MEEQLPGIYKAGKNELPFAEVLDNIDVGIVVYDRNGNFVFVNRVMINWRNIPRNEYLTMNVRDFYGFIDVCVYDLGGRLQRHLHPARGIRHHQPLHCRGRDGAELQRRIAERIEVEKI